MRAVEIIADDNCIVETKMVWAKKGNKIARKYRCTFGSRKGRTVSDPSQCSKPIDQKKRMVMRRTKAQKGSRMTRKAMRTKRTNMASKMIRTLNR
jgi:hypothetical protein